MRPPGVVLFDVNGTLSDMSPMGARWEAVGASPDMAQRWFAEVLRDGFALAAAGGSAPFAVVAEHTARRLLVASSSSADLDEAVAHVMEGFTQLGVHPDVPEGIRALRRRGCRLATLSNGSASVAEQLLTTAGLRAELEQVLSVERAPRWKPAAEAYGYALSVLEVDAQDVMLVAVHPWDVDGAARAGLRTAWIDRAGQEYPGFLRAPDLTARSLTELAAALDRDA